jgi:hypothetical protein
MSRPDDEAMTVAIAGASGLVGTALTERLIAEGHRVLRMVRPTSTDAGAHAVSWNPPEGTIDADALRGVDALVYLAGENLGSGRWTEARKKRIWSSRVDGMTLVAETLATLDGGPKTLVGASAVGFYGDTGDREVDERAEKGSGFLADLCEAWEGATAPASAAGVRVVHARFGVVLSPKGGALAKMLPAFRLGAGGPLGDGRQYMSWITLEDTVAALVRALGDSEIAGPVNVVAPRPVRNRELTRALGRVLGRPAVLAAPKLALRLAFGAQMAEEMLLTGQRVRPARLEAAGFHWDDPELEPALQRMLSAN